MYYMAINADGGELTSGVSLQAALAVAQAYADEHGETVDVSSSDGREKLEVKPLEVEFTREAHENIEETGADWRADLAALRASRHTEASLLEHCLEGADDDRVQGWREYVQTLAIAAGI